MNRIILTALLFYAPSAFSNPCLFGFADYTEEYFELMENPETAPRFPSFEEGQALEDAEIAFNCGSYELIAILYKDGAIMPGFGVAQCPNNTDVFLIVVRENEATKFDAVRSFASKYNLHMYQLRKKKYGFKCET